jgi:DNA-binding transcriptional LysR family regulator
MVPAMIWMFEQVSGKAPVSRSNTMSNLVHAVRAGLGIAPLPCVVADADTRPERGRQLRERAAANDGEAADLSRFRSPA